MPTSFPLVFVSRLPRIVYTINVWFHIWIIFNPLRIRMSGLVNFYKALFNLRYHTLSHCMFAFKTNKNMIHLNDFNMCNYRSAIRALNHQTPGSTFQARGAQYPNWGTRRTICSPTCILAPPTWSLFGHAPPKASAKQLSLRSPPTSLVRSV